MCVYVGGIDHCGYDILKGGRTKEAHAHFKFILRGRNHYCESSSGLLLYLHVRSAGLCPSLRIHMPKRHTEKADQLPLY